MRYQYINNNPMYGIKRDFKLLDKEFNKMLKKCNAPTGLYKAQLPDDDANWFVLMSERSSSKTTQMLLKYGLVNNMLYGLKFAYVRREKSQTTQSMYNKLFEVINSPVYGYINYLTKGRYNNLVVDRQTKNIYYALVNNDTGKIEERCEVAVGVLMSVEEYARYCSTFNVNDYDTIIFDEFSWGKYATNDEFYWFCQIIATLRRERRSLKIYMLSNTITPYNVYLKNLGVASNLAKMTKGQKRIVTSSLGARVYCELLDVGMHKTVEFKASALEYFGFENKQLRSLYGGEWEIKGFRHLPHSVERTINWTNIFLEYMGSYIRVATFTDNQMTGLFISAYTGKPKDNAVVLPLNPTYHTDSLRHRNRRLVHRLQNVDDLGLLYFSDNETALQYYAYIKEF